MFQDVKDLHNFLHAHQHLQMLNYQSETCVHTDNASWPDNEKCTEADMDSAGNVIGFREVAPQPDWHWWSSGPTQAIWSGQRSDPKKETLTVKPAEEAKPVTTRRHYPIGH